MSNLLISRRAVLTGLFVAPAIVAATNLMPIKAIEKFTLSDFNPNNEKWVLVRGRLDNAPMIWMRNSQFEIYSERSAYNVVKTQFLEPVLKHKNQWAEDTIRLNNIVRASVITESLPSHMIDYSDKITGFEAKVVGDRWIIGT